MPDQRSSPGTRGVGTFTHQARRFALRTSDGGRASSETDRPMGERDAAQAEVLIRALCDLRDKMTSQANRLEKLDSQRDAAALRRDIDEAQAHIVGLRHRYLGVETPVPGPPRGLAGRRIAQPGRN